MRFEDWHQDDGHQARRSASRSGMLIIVHPSAWTRCKRLLRRLHIGAHAGTWRGFYKAAKQIHKLPETREPSGLGKAASR